MRPRSKIAFRRLEGGRVIVRLPRLFDVYLEFKGLFPRAKPGPRAWTFLLVGKSMLPRLGQWDRRRGGAIAEDVRRRERRRQDAEWDALEAIVAASPVDAGVVDLIDRAVAMGGQRR